MYAFFKKLFSFILIFVSASLGAQSLLYPGDYFFEAYRQGSAATDTNVVIHTSMQPFLYPLIGTDTITKMKPRTDPGFDKLLYDHVIEVKHIDRSSGYERKFNFEIDPILHFMYGKDVMDTGTGKVTNNTRGFRIQGQLGKKLEFETAFMENQSFTPEYLDTYIKATGVVPGQGRYKVFKKEGYDYGIAYGILNFTASRNFTLRLGHGKQKVGHGYRSVLLSDNSFNYPYVQLIGNFLKGKIQYAQTYALLMNLTAGGTKTPPNTERIFQKKAATFQQLSWKPIRKLEAYLFQGTIWKATDTNNLMHLDPLYANPILFTNLAKFGFNNSNHILAGGGMQYRVVKKLFYYNQFVYDGSYVDSSKATPVTVTNWGVQNGVKLYMQFGKAHLFLQAEMNNFNGAIYSGGKYPAEGYTHYNQTLTTNAYLPNELVGVAAFKYKRFFVQLKENYYFDNTSAQTITCFDARSGWMLNPAYNLNISVGCSLRAYDSGIKTVAIQSAQVFYVAFKTSLYNLYYDF